MSLVEFNASNIQFQTVHIASAMTHSSWIHHKDLLKDMSTSCQLLPMLIHTLDPYLSNHAMETTDLLTTAARFVNSTDSHIFLTGKAGTGKTTFLRNIAANTHKRFVIVAPTGIAALNAGGVTIHSQFLLPFGTFIPDRQAPEGIGQGTNYYTQRTLATKHPLNKPRRQVLRGIDLLIIDEVSMLRADLLDAIDYRMRAVRNNFNRSFGGVQVLMIGDLYQLPPIVKDSERDIMGRYYRTPHFFEAKALQQDGYVFVELDRIFRQRDDKFISLLNNLRNNIVTQDDITELNSHYRPEGETRLKDDEDIITITTHNYRADNLNQKALEALTGHSHFFDADIENDFPESAYPLPARIELKKGAQIMFVKNDSLEGIYFNGKLARIHEIDDEGIHVRLSGSGSPYTLRLEKWENKRYTVNDSTRELEEEIIGTFTQYPVKLAWAITVHKSQGLTFEKAVIDVGQAFAPGQVYVALSRLTSLDGLELRTRIDPGVVSTDKEVIDFSRRKETQGDIDTILAKKQAEFLQAMLADTFSLSGISSELNQLMQKQTLWQEFEDADMRGALPSLAALLAAERLNTDKFTQQLQQLIRSEQRDSLLDRIGKGKVYYLEQLKGWVKHLLIHIGQVRMLSKTKTYVTALEEIDLLLMKKWDELEKAVHLTKAILEGRDLERLPDLDHLRMDGRAQLMEEVRKMTADNPKNSERKTGRVRKAKDPNSPAKPKQVKGQTYLDTYALIDDGLTLDQVAETRGLGKATIEGHVAKGIAEGRFSIEKFLTSDQLTEITAVLGTDGKVSLNDAFDRLDKKYSFGQLRMVMAKTVISL